MSNGFSTKDGLFAMFGLIGAIIVALLGFGLRFHLSVIFILLISLVFVLYGKNLCRCCGKNCPCNPNMKFWHEMFKKK